MNRPEFLTLRRIVAFSVVVEIGTAVVMMIAPAVVAAMLVRGEVTDMSTLIARCMGVALLALGLACWPERQPAGVGVHVFRALLAYNALIALVLGYTGAVLRLDGPLLWPAVALHGAVASALVWVRRAMPSAP